jgi:multimeric flavodoxin WrbA
MKIFFLNGSLRGERGATFKLLSSIGTGIEKAGGTWNIANLSGLKIESCRACGHCQRTKTYKCIFDDKDDVKTVFDKMRDADMLIYASPVYVFGISNILKRLLERFHACAPVGEVLLTKSGLFFHPTERSLSEKPFVSLVVCDNVEDLTVRNTKDFFRIFGRFMDAPHVGHLEHRGAAAWMAALDGIDDSARKRAQGILDGYERAGEELVLKGRISGETKRKTQRPFLKIPLPVRAARHIPVLRPLIAKELRKRAQIINQTIGTK